MSNLERSGPGSEKAGALRPPGGRVDSPGRGRPRGWVWLLLGLAVTAAVGVAVLLPGVVEQLSVTRTTPATAQPKPASPEPIPVDPPEPAGAQPADGGPSAESAGTETDANRDAATRALQGYLRIRARPELAQAEIWGDPDWGEAETRAAVAENYLREEQFAAAALGYDQAVQALEVLISQRAARLAGHLAAATGALHRNEVEAAVAAYQRVLAMDPGHAQAAAGLARAQVRHEVVGLTEAGQRHEDGVRLAEALQSYQAALALDAAYEPAGGALQRVQNEIEMRQFRAAMSRGLTALDAGDLEAAGVALADARRLRPGDAALRDASQRLTEARQRARLAALRSRAAALIAGEDWQGAAERYEQALAVDANAAFARHGLTRARERLALHRSLDHYLGAPARLGSAEPLANAQQLLAAAGAASPDEPRLGAKLAALRTQVDLYRTPINVTLHSDGETEVTVYHVGRLGRFREKHLELRPGQYTITGTRPGYRDIRRVLELRPGATTGPVTIQCEEVI